MKQQTSSLILIGNEILSGRTKDKNLEFIAVKMTEHGVPLREVRVIPDVEETIIATVNEMRGRYDYVFTTGGIGPTHDDITALAVSKALGVKLEENPDAYEMLLKHYGMGDLTESRRKMAQIPVGASLIRNPVSSAPGFRVENVFVMAGVPKIMQAMMDHVLEMISKGAEIFSVTVSCDLPESLLAAELTALQDEYKDVDIGSYPYFYAGDFGVSLVMRGLDEARVKDVADKVRAVIAGHGVESR